MSESLKENPSPEESPKENPDKKSKGSIADTLRGMYGAPAASKEGPPAVGGQPENNNGKRSNQPKPKPKAEPAPEQRAIAADAILKGWPDNGESRAKKNEPNPGRGESGADKKESEPAKTEMQAKNEFTAGAERFLNALSHVEASAEFNGVEEKYNFKCNNLFLVNGQPKPLNAIREDLKNNKVSTNEISFDFQMEKINSLDTNHMKLSVPVADFINGGEPKVRAVLSKMVQNIYGAAHQGTKTMEAADRTKLMTAQSSADAFKANRPIVNQIKSAAAGKECGIAEFNNPESRETLMVINLPKKGTQISLSLSGGAIGRASINGKLIPGGPKEVINAIKGA